MKITIEIDCTPEEARRLAGLPDVTAINEAVTQAMQDRMTEAVREFDAEAAAKSWVDAALGGMSRMQEAFWTQARGGKPEGDDK